MKNTRTARPANDATMSTEYSATMANCLAAGLTSAEWRYHPQHGLLISASGVRKLAAMAPNGPGKQAVLDTVAACEAAAAAAKR